MINLSLPKFTGTSWIAPEFGQFDYLNDSVVSLAHCVCRRGPRMDPLEAPPKSVAKNSCLGESRVWESSSPPRGSPQKFSQLAIKKNSANWRVSCVQLNLGGLSVPGAPIRVCHGSRIPWTWVFAIRGLCRVNQIFIITVIWFLSTVSSCSVGRRGICSTSRILQSSTGGGVTGGAHSLRSRHKDAAFHARMAQSTFLIIWVKIRIRRRRVRGLCVSKSTSTFRCEPWIGHPRAEGGVHALRWHLPAYHGLLQSWGERGRKL